jgi:hypothetical protein
MWGYVLNAVHTGHPLGVGTGALDDRAAPAYPRSLANVFYYLYGLMDLSALSDRVIWALALAGLAAASAILAVRLLRGGPARPALAGAARFALPFAAPLLVLGCAGVLAFLSRGFGFPIRGPGGLVAPLESSLNEVYTRIDNENYAAFGPLGIVALLAAIGLAVRAYRLGRADARHLALALALPCFLGLMSLQSLWNPYLLRFFLVPAVLAAPLLALLFRGRATAAAYLVVAALTITITLVNDQSRPLDSRFGPPWTLSQQQAFAVDFEPGLGALVGAYASLVPRAAPVGAVLGPNEANYLLFGPNLEHRVDFLSVDNAELPAVRAGLFYVVISTGPDRWVADTFRAAGWSIRPLAGYWLLASDLHAGNGQPRDLTDGTASSGGRRLR